MKIDDFQAISERTPLLVDLKPAGRSSRWMSIRRAEFRSSPSGSCEGGMWMIPRSPARGVAFGEEAAEAEETPGQEVIRPLDKPLKKHWWDS